MRHTAILILLFQFKTLFAQDAHVFSRFSSQPTPNKTVIDSIPEFRLEGARKSTQGVTFIDNSKLKYFPAIFNQRGNSCSQASGIRNLFTYEMNFVRNQSASSSSNVYSYHYTWNFLNGGKDYGSWYYDGFSLVQDNGVASISDFPDESGQTTERTWMSGYDKYYRAMKNRIESYSKIDAGSADGLSTIKQYLTDHGNGSDAGGLLVFSGKSSNWDMISYSGPSNTGYTHAVRKFGDGGDHAMTIVGFDDDVAIDVNGDGTIQNDERGALIIVNSWGTGWGSNGRAYISYKLLTTDWWSGGIGNGDHFVYVVKAKDHTPTVTAKINLTYTSRNDLWFILGVAREATAQSQEKTKTLKVFKKQGGDYYMQGTSEEAGKTIEIGLDFSDLIASMPDAKKFFITVKQSIEGSLGEGKVIGYSVLDYRNSETPTEYICPDRNVAITGTTQLTVSLSPNSIEKPYNHYLSNIYPNPAGRGDDVYIPIPQGLVNQKISIGLVDLTGKVVNSQSAFYAETALHRLTVPDQIRAGVYLLRIIGENSYLTGKIIIR